jgi:hypothetical protein
METEEQRTRRIFVDQSEQRLIKSIKKVQEGKYDSTTKERFLTLIRQEVDKADSKLHDCLSQGGEHDRRCYINYGQDIGWVNNTIETTRNAGVYKSFYLPCVPELLDDETNSIIKETNEKITERTSYGRRNELTEHNSLVLTWSNNSKAWYPTAKTKKGETVDLDANMILLKDAKDKVKLGHTTSCLQPFPLYSLSFEAIHERKETPLLEGTAMWVERQLSKEKEITERKKHV